MTFAGQIAKAIPDYELARSLGLASGGDINFTALANQLDCSRNFSQAGIIFSDGARQWLATMLRGWILRNGIQQPILLLMRFHLPGMLRV